MNALPRLRSVAPLALLSLALLFSVAAAQTRPRPAPGSTKVRTELIPLKYISAYDVIALFGGTVIDGRPGFMSQARGGLNNQFVPYGSTTHGGYQQLNRSPLGSSVMSLPGNGVQWGTMARAGANGGLGAAAAAGILTYPGVLPSGLSDLGLSLIGWPQTNAIIFDGRLGATRRVETTEESLK